VVNASKADFNKISNNNSTNKDKVSEINQYYDQLQSYVINKFDTQSVSRLISEIQNDLSLYYRYWCDCSYNSIFHIFLYIL
jgi:hypothetical protein